MEQKRDSGLGVSLAKPRVALSAPSPRADYRAVGFPLQSLTRTTVLVAFAGLLAISVTAQSRVQWEQESVKYQYADTSNGETAPAKGITLGKQMQIMFDCCFSDSVNVLLNGKLLKKAYFSTDPSTSFASSITIDFGEDEQVLRIELPEKGVFAEIVLDKRYRVLHVNRMAHWNRTWWITFQNFHSFYE